MSVSNSGLFACCSGADRLRLKQDAFLHVVVVVLQYNMAPMAGCRKEPVGFAEQGFTAYGSAEFAAAPVEKARACPVFLVPGYPALRKWSRHGIIVVFFRMLAKTPIPPFVT